MSQLDEILKTGDEILNEVNRAVNSGDYSNLGDSIREQVKDAVDKATANVNQNFNGRASAGRTVTYSGSRLRTPFFMKKISSSKGIGKIIGGVIGSVYVGMWTIIMGIAAFAEPVITIPALIFAAITGLFVFMVHKGKEDRKLVKAYNKYGRILGRSEYFAINDLAIAAAENPDTVKSNIRKMIKKEYLPLAKMDLSETTVMLTNRAYQQYINAEASRQERERREKMASANTQTRAMPTEQAAPTADSKVAGIVKEGKAYIENIRRINEMIPGDEMSAKLFHLESIMQRIFQQVENEPECADDLKKFMNYYLPTTTKLLNAYVDLDKQPEVGDNIVKTKKEIEDAIDVINSAFENLLDSLFQDMAWDITSDISVMKTMMAQDGLTDGGIRDTVVGQGTATAQMQQMAQAMPTASAMTAQGAAQAMPQGQQEAQAAPQTELKF